MRCALLLGCVPLVSLLFGWSLAQPSKPAKPPSLAELAAPRPVDIAELPDGFSEKIVATGLTGATAMAVAPDGRLFVCEQTGTLRVIKDDRLLDEPFVTLKVDSSWERGLIGVTLDPAFPEKPYVYLCYVAAEPYPHHRVSRFTARGDGAVSGSEVVLLEGDDQTKLGGRIPNGHQGGVLRFGKDGKLYVGIGEQTAGAPAQRLSTFQGKLLRINADGSIPEDNPFAKETTGKYRAIWARGLRNPFGLAVQPGTGRLFFTDVGEARWEEVNEAVAGANYGWPHAEGPGTDPKYRGPIYAYDRSLGRSVTGGVFYDPPVKQFPARYVGKFFFAEYIDNWVRVLDPGNPKAVSVFATGLAGPVDLQVGPDGSLYYLNRNVWVKDGKFKPRTSSVHRVSYTANARRPAPVITAQPGDVTAVPGQPTAFRIEVRGGEPLTYQWQRNGVPIAGATAARYALSAVAAADHGAQLRCVVSNAFGATRSAKATVWITDLRPAVSVGRVGPGLAYDYVEGPWSHLPDFKALKPARRGSSKGLDLTVRRRDEHFGLAYRGFLHVPADGVYEFFLTASGASKLFIAGAEVASVGLASGPREASSSVGLKAGKHPLLLLFAHGDGRPRLHLSWAGPALAKQPVPESALFRTDPDAPATPSVAPAGHGLPPRETVTTLHVPADAAALPPLLSQTGVFASLKDLTPNPGIIPYDVNAPLWSDGAAKRRWIALPGDERVGFTLAGEWKFPAGTVFVKHFEIDADADPVRRRLETRLLVVDRTGNGYGATYRWRPDQSDAELLPDSASEEIVVRTPAGPRKQTWYYPSRGECLVCHTANAGFVLGVNTRQLNRSFAYPVTGVTDNQLRTWNHAGLLGPGFAEADLPRYSRLAAIDDPTASLEHRARSYLDSNCAQCHRPGGSRGEFDARFDTPLSAQKLLRGKLVSSDLGVRAAKLVSPGSPALSMLHLRMARRQDVFNMPPLATNVVDAEALAVLAEWIKGLPADAPKPADVPKPDGPGRFLRLHWYEPGIENGNPVSNRRFRVNAPEAVLHPNFGSRSEVRSSGMLQVRMDEDPRLLAGVKLYLELWGGHPGTANKRVTPNGRTTYPLPGTAEKHCTHFYPVVPLKPTDVVNGYNALQFACDQGTANWGHFIVDNACLRAVLKDDHPDLKKAGLTGFQASVKAVPANRTEAIELSLAVPPEHAAAVERVDFEGFYQGYDENGDGRATDWHGFTKAREPVAILGTARQAPFTLTWDLTMLPAQKDVAVRAVVRFKDRSNLVYVTPPTRGLRTPERPRFEVGIYLSKDLPQPFWSRASRKKSCTIELDVEPAKIEQAELHVVVWDGGAGGVKDYFTLNGRPLAVAGTGKHDVIYSRLQLDPKMLRKGTNTIELLSDTEHHGIEVLLPGPALVVRARR